MRIIIDPDEAAKALELAFSDVIDQLKKARDDGLTVEINVLGGGRRLPHRHPHHGHGRGQRRNGSAEQGDGSGNAGGY